VPEERRETYYRQRISEAGSRYPEFDRLATEAAFNLLYTYEVFHQYFARYMAEFGLSKSTLNILMLLRNGPPEGMQLHDLGALLLVSRANITGLIDHLEEKDYVQRVVDQSDRRVRLARITKKGELLLDRFLPVHYANLKLMLRDVSDSEKESLVRLLRAVRLSLTTHADGLAAGQNADYNENEHKEGYGRRGAGIAESGEESAERR
jgi:MarR family 2-MHQ and catechol resistance regulon transcriptional repressor